MDFWGRYERFQPTKIVKPNKFRKLKDDWVNNFAIYVNTLMNYPCNSLEESPTSPISNVKAAWTVGDGNILLISDAKIMSVLVMYS